ncbi:ATP-binding protein [Nocardiopsis sp. NRRL B-16309]|uniref:ATP-binding protein n=1 Tax=Nocardiopsis sp. NRRL B-16309 TaxID=1519494 RepID=UPI001E365D3E|nr:ATP-binding protein [Nocardiopsis sp. NRRL B-16309]
MLPRRSRDAQDRAPIVLDRRAEVRGHAMVVAGVPEEARMLRYRLGALSGLPGEKRHRLRLLAGELFTNAITHSRSGRPGGLVTVTVFRLPGRVQVKVTDEGPLGDEVATPCVRPCDPERVGGLGLRLVALEADRWGVVHEVREGRGTTVWFEIDREGPPGEPAGPGEPTAPGELGASGEPAGSGELGASGEPAGTGRWADMSTSRHGDTTEPRDPGLRPTLAETPASLDAVHRLAMGVGAESEAAAIARSTDSLRSPWR